MNRTLLRPRSTARAAALGALVIALAGCSGGSDEGGSSAPPADEPATSEQGEDGADGAASDDGGAASDEGATSGGEGASDGGGAGTDTGQDGAAAAAALPKDADLATEELPITAERAIEIATETVGGGELVQIEIDHDRRAGEWEWELELVADGTQHELDIDATTGEVTAHDTDNDDDQDPVIDVASPMTYAEAIEIAVGEEPGRVSGWDLDSDDGQIRYQIDIVRAEGGDVDVEVDVETGDVRIDD